MIPKTSYYRFIVERYINLPFFAGSVFNVSALQLQGSEDPSERPHTLCLSYSGDGIRFLDLSVSGSSCQVNQQSRINERKLEKIDCIHRQNIIHTFYFYSPLSRKAHNDDSGHDKFTVGGLLFSLNKVKFQHFL